MVFCYRPLSSTLQKYITPAKRSRLVLLFVTGANCQTTNNLSHFSVLILWLQWAVFAVVASEFKQDNEPGELWPTGLARLCGVWRLPSFWGQTVTSQFNQEANSVDLSPGPIHTLHSWCQPNLDRPRVRQHLSSVLSSVSGRKMAKTGAVADHYWLSQLFFCYLREISFSWKRPYSLYRRFFVRPTCSLQE